VADPAVAVGARVRIRSVLADRPRIPPLSVSAEGDPEQPITIVCPGAMGLYRLSTRTPLGRALLGHHVGDVVEVPVQAGTARFEVLAVEGAGHDDDTVRLGSIVRVHDGDLVEWWRIVPHDRADTLRGWLSARSLLGGALIGHCAGDVVHVPSPGSPGRGRPVTILDVCCGRAWD
jgi:transcription elongation GreA/GreB family factor